MFGYLCCDSFLPVQHLNFYLPFSCLPFPPSLAFSILSFYSLAFLPFSFFLTLWSSFLPFFLPSFLPSFLPWLFFYSSYFFLNLFFYLIFVFVLFAFFSANVLHTFPFHLISLSFYAFHPFFLFNFIFLSPFLSLSLPLFSYSSLLLLPSFLTCVTNSLPFISSRRAPLCH